MKTSFRLLSLIGLITVVSSLHAATFVVPPDRDLIDRSELIITGAALTSYTQLTPEGGVETVTPISVQEVIKGKIARDTINVVEPGGTYRDLTMLIPGSPRFADGEQVLLLLRATGEDRWSVAELVLGKFAFRTDATGQKLLVRDEDEIIGIPI